MIGKTLLLCAAVGWFSGPHAAAAASRPGEAGPPILVQDVLELLRDPVKVSRLIIPNGLILVATARERKIVDKLVQATDAYRRPTEKGPRPPRGVTIAVTTLNNGIRLKITAGDAEAIRRIHELDISPRSPEKTGRK